jgi:hypothetical protein
MERIQLIRLTKNKGNGNVWINPAQIIYAEQAEDKESKEAKDKSPKFLTILHVSGREDKLFVKEAPDEINKIIRNLKAEKEVKEVIYYK